MKRILFLVLLGIPTVSLAGIYCTEEITTVILHKNSELYFQSSETCPNSWCQIKWVGEGDKDRAFSMLLAAKTASKKVVIYWESLDSCDEENPTYTSPGFIKY